MVQVHAGSNLPQPHPTASASLGVFGGAAERFQPCFTLATKNIEHEGLGANSASLTVLGALDQLGESLWGSGWPRDGVSWLAKHKTVFREQW